MFKKNKLNSDTIISSEGYFDVGKTLAWHKGLFVLDIGTDYEYDGLNIDITAMSIFIYNTLTKGFIDSYEERVYVCLLKDIKYETNPSDWFQIEDYGDYGHMSFVPKLEYENRVIPLLDKSFTMKSRHSYLVEVDGTDVPLSIGDQQTFRKDVALRFTNRYKKINNELFLQSGWSLHVCVVGSQDLTPLIPPFQKANTTSLIRIYASQRGK